MKFGFEEKVAVGLYVFCMLLVLIGSAVTGQNSYPYRYENPAPLQSSPSEPQ